MKSLVSQIAALFKKSASTSRDEGAESFAARFHRFRLFLSAYLDAYSEMMNFEERLADERPFGMPFLRACTARLTVATMQCVMQLNALGNGGFTRLNDPFSALRSDIQSILDKGTTPLYGPLLVPFEELGEEHASLVSPNMLKLETIGREHPEFMPRGFIITGAAWWLYFNNPEMHEEIDRLTLISQEDTASYNKAAVSIRERLDASFPLPGELEDAIREKISGMQAELDMPGYALVLRCMPVLQEHSALVMPEQVLYTPTDAEAVIKAVQSTLSMSFRTRAMIYRLKRGIRDRGMPFCLSLTLMPEVHGRGSTHRKLETLNPDELLVHIRRGFTAPDENAPQECMDPAALPADILAKVEQYCATALSCLSDAPVRGNRHELFWAISEMGRFYVMGANTLPDPPEEEAPMPPEASGMCLKGGFSTYPGKVVGNVTLVRHLEDALAFPIGNILVLSQAAPRWSFLLDFASAAVCGGGTGNGLFARTARRYGRPTILRQQDAFEMLESDQGVCLLASADHEPEICVYPDGVDNQFCPIAQFHIPAAAYPLCDEHIGSTGRHGPLWLPSSVLAEMARELAPKVVSRTLPDSDSVDFRAENCRTFHDFLSYCHVHAVQEMFRSGTSSKASGAPAKQLVCDVPKQFWIINLDDGFHNEVSGPVVKLEEIASLPMLALWEGFTAKPWDGPPQIDAKGFLSVLFEATANPNLDPASQSTQYTEKNVFLIAERFCSMRCRFGFHFLAMDCLLGERERERFIVFQFKGGAANLARRIRRVHFVAELLSQFDFATEIVGDSLTARLEGADEAVFVAALRVLGYITMHTRQLDMIMGDEEALANHRAQMLDDMFTLAETGELPDAGRTAEKITGE